jgi:hypothetical protein
VDHDRANPLEASTFTTLSKKGKCGRNPEAAPVWTNLFPPVGEIGVDRREVCRYGPLVARRQNAVVAHDAVRGSDRVWRRTLMMFGGVRKLWSGVWSWTLMMYDTSSIIKYMSSLIFISILIIHLIKKIKFFKN